MARYIDAERLKRTFASGIRVYDGMCKIEDVMHNIDNEPTADVEEVKHAHWREGRFLKVCDSTKGYPSVICSDCGITFCDIINNHNYMYRCCPNCGAKMNRDGDAE